MAEKTCHWHQCRAPFTSNHHRARFCSAACRVSHAEWAKARGAAIVNTMIDTRDDRDLFVRKILDQRRKILAETQAPLTSASSMGSKK